MGIFMGFGDSMVHEEYEAQIRAESIIRCHGLEGFDGCPLRNKEHLLERCCVLAHKLRAH